MHWKATASTTQRTAALIPGWNAIYISNNARVQMRAGYVQTKVLRPK